MSQVRNVAREYWFELLIALLAIAGMLELVVGRDSPVAPSTTLWFSVPAMAVLVLPLFARRRFPFAAPGTSSIRPPTRFLSPLRRCKQRTRIAQCGLAFP